MRDSSLNCTARPSMAAILAPARWLAFVMNRRSSSSQARSSGVAAKASLVSMAGSRSASSPANCRSVGISPMPWNSLRIPSEAGNQGPRREKRQLVEDISALPE